jgi:hypothetical protein
LIRWSDDQRGTASRAAAAVARGLKDDCVADAGQRREPTRQIGERCAFAGHLDEVAVPPDHGE